MAGKLTAGRFRALGEKARHLLRRCEPELTDTSDPLDPFGAFGWLYSKARRLKLQRHVDFCVRHGSKALRSSNLHEARLAFNLLFGIVESARTWERRTRRRRAHRRARAPLSLLQWLRLEQNQYRTAKARAEALKKRPKTDRIAFIEQQRRAGASDDEIRAAAHAKDWPRSAVSRLLPKRREPPLTLKG